VENRPTATVQSQTSFDVLNGARAIVYFPFQAGNCIRVSGPDGCGSPIKNVVQMDRPCSTWHKQSLHTAGQCT